LFKSRKDFLKICNAYRKNLFFSFPLAAKNEADRQAEKREIKRRLTRKVLLASVL